MFLTTAQQMDGDNLCKATVKQNKFSSNIHNLPGDSDEALPCVISSIGIPF